MILAPPQVDTAPVIGTAEHAAEVARLTRRWAPLGYEPVMELGDDGLFNVHTLFVAAHREHLRRLVVDDDRIDCMIEPAMGRI